MSSDTVDPTLRTLSQALVQTGHARSTVTRSCVINWVSEMQVKRAAGDRWAMEVIRQVTSPSIMEAALGDEPPVLDRAAD